MIAKFEEKIINQIPWGGSLHIFRSGEHDHRQALRQL